MRGYERKKRKNAVREFCTGSFHSRSEQMAARMGLCNMSSAVIGAREIVAVT